MLFDVHIAEPAVRAEEEACATVIIDTVSGLRDPAAARLLAIGPR
jgi:hypothetical protein